MRIYVIPLQPKTNTNTKTNTEPGTVSTTMEQVIIFSVDHNMLNPVKAHLAVFLHLGDPIIVHSYNCFCIFILRARVCWPLLCLCRPFCIFERCLDSNP
jgi:hypothetical protein